MTDESDCSSPREGPADAQSVGGAFGFRAPRSDSTGRCPSVRVESVILDHICRYSFCLPSFGGQTGRFSSAIVRGRTHQRRGLQ